MPFTERQSKAMDEARPLRERAVELNAQAKAFDDQLKERRKARQRDEAALSALEEQWKAICREAPETDAKAEAIENAAYDLKAVNPNRKSDEDKRTPAELLEFIGSQGKDADAALARLHELVAAKP